MQVVTAVATHVMAKSSEEKGKRGEGVAVAVEVVVLTEV